MSAVSSASSGWRRFFHGCSSRGISPRRVQTALFSEQGEVYRLAHLLITRRPRVEATPGALAPIDTGLARALAAGVPAKLDSQLPLEALRDLLGVVRALYAAWKPAQGPIELEELRDIGQELAAAFELARKTTPDTLGHRAAWSRAEAATKRLGHLVGTLEPLKPMLVAAAQRVVGERGEPRALSEREAKRLHQRKRN